MLPLLRTVVKIPEFDNKISYGSRIMFLGSCFSEEIGNKLRHFLFDIDLNPFGIIYNPASVYNSLEILLEKKFFQEKDVFQRGQLWLSFNHHSRFSSTSRQELLVMINHRIELSHKQLLKSNFLFITLGTAWVYQLKQTGKVVSNCHKLPQKIFTRRLLDIDEIVQMYAELLPRVWEINPNLEVVFTISPVRHWKDGAIGNQQSKASLIIAVQKLVEQFDRVKYFPSYEIVMDELRDYRFYADDMLHIGSGGIEYIWLRFRKTFFDQATDQALEEVNKVLKATQHRPQNKDTDEYRKFLASTIEKIMLLRKHHPYIKIGDIQQYFMNEQKKYGYAD